MKGQQLLAGTVPSGRQRLPLAMVNMAPAAPTAGTTLDLLTALRLVVWFRSRSMWLLIIFCFLFAFLFVLSHLLSFLSLLSFH